MDNEKEIWVILLDGGVSEKTSNVSLTIEDIALAVLSSASMATEPRIKVTDVNFTQIAVQLKELGSLWKLFCLLLKYELQITVADAKMVEAIVKQMGPNPMREIIKINLRDFDICEIQAFLDQILKSELKKPVGV